VEITVNGQPREVSESITIAQLIAEMKLPPRFLAVERNLRVVPREQHEQCRLEPGDRLEIVTLVGGG
jgi:thiamine biosynthesis protein ThiS